MTAHPTDNAEWVRDLLDQHESGLVRYAARLLGQDVERARDVVQDSFLKLIGMDRADVEDHVAEWLYTVCRNRCLDVLRKERRMRQLSEHQERRLARSEAEASAGGHEQHAEVRALFEALPQRQQEVIRLKLQSGLSYREISRVTDLSVSNVGFLIHTGLKAVRERLKAEGLPS